MESFLNKVNDDWTLFLDRDGTINKRNFDGYITDWASFEFIPGVLDALALARFFFSRIIIVTNQQGVGKKVMTKESLLDIHEKMLEEIGIHGGIIDEVFVCDSLASEYPNCRKPSPEMAFLAKEKFPEINFRKSIMIGDTTSDIEFGRACEMYTILIKSAEKYTGYKPDLTVDSIKNFIEMLTKIHT